MARHDDMRHCLNASNEAAQIAGTVKSAVRAHCQFKRSARPNSPKAVSGGNLSPRGDWRAPSDGNAALWLAELDENVPNEVQDN